MAQWIPVIIMAATKVATALNEGENKGRQENIQGDVAFQNAEATRRQASAQEDTLRRREAMRMGDVRARAVETGFESSSGSLASVQARSAAELELEALTERYKSELTALSFENEGKIHRYLATVNRRTGYLNAVAGLAQSYSNYSGNTRMPSSGATSSSGDSGGTVGNGMKGSLSFGGKS